MNPQKTLSVVVRLSESKQRGFEGDWREESREGEWVIDILWGMKEYSNLKTMKQEDLRVIRDQNIERPT
jgi:hypothetical protein